MDSICLNCNRLKPKFARDYCSNCYSVLMKNGIISKLPTTPMPDKLSQYQSEILIGSLLGDGHLSRKNKNASLIIGRSIKDKDYLLWEYDIFKEFCSAKAIRKRTWINPTNKHMYADIRFGTRNSEALTPYHNLWYPNKKKIIPHNLQLSPLIILIWFLDDGCLCRTNAGTLEIELATDGFTHKEVEYLAQLLSIRYNNYFRIHKNSQTNDPNRGYRIHACEDTAKSIILDIKDVWPDCMNRKRLWTEDDFKRNSQKSKKLNPSISNDMLCQALRTFGDGDIFTCNDISELVYDKVSDTAKKNISTYSNKRVARFIKLGFIEIIGESAIQINPNGTFISRKYKLTESGKIFISGGG